MMRAIASLCTGIMTEIAERVAGRKSTEKSRRNERFAYALLLIAPVLFASNMLAARASADVIPPVALAFWRWTAMFALLLPFTGAALFRARYALRREWPDLLVLGALGMGVCGAFVYVGAHTTTATNIGLIFSASPVLIILLASVVYGEAMSRLQGVGVALSLAGVLAVVSRGDPAVFLQLQFTVGDLWVLGATVGWAVYSVLSRYRQSALGTMPRLAAICFGGMVVLAPFHLWEVMAGAVPAFDARTVFTVAFVALFSSIGAYGVYAHIQSSLGASRTGLLMYLIPLYNGVLAYLLFGETLQAFHLVGAALVLPGLYLATRSPG